MKPKVTIVIVPRERFSFAIESLNSLLENTREPYKLVYVDGNSPRRVHNHLLQKSAELRFQYVRKTRYLSPNEARNIGLKYVNTELVAFVDNDVIFDPGWLENLVECADETGAWIVGPLYLERHYNRDLIHMATGTIVLEGEAPERTLRIDMKDHKEPYKETKGKYTRQVTDVAEFHVVLFRSAALRSIGGFDPDLQCTREHVDAALTVKKAGGQVYFEPKAVVRYVIPKRITISDLRYFLFRWQESKAVSDASHFSRKWGVKLEKYRPSIMRQRRKMAIRATLPVTVQKCLKHLHM